VTTSPTNFSLSKPAGRTPIDIGTLSYFRQRNKGRVYDLVIEEFERSGITQADLAVRLGKGADQISRWLGSPGNWTLDTESDLLFAISGAEPVYNLKYPLDEPQRNFRYPEWIEMPIFDQFVTDDWMSHTVSIDDPVKSVTIEEFVL
jgi:hypothetical protein